MTKVEIKVSQSREDRHTWVHLHSFLTSPLERVNGQLHAPAALLPGGTPLPPPTEQEGSRPQSWSGSCRTEINRFPWPGIESRFLGHPARSLVTILTTLSRLLVNKNRKESCELRKFSLYRLHNTSEPWPTYWSEYWFRSTKDPAPGNKETSTMRALGSDMPTTQQPKRMFNSARHIYLNQERWALRFHSFCLQMGRTQSETS